jgi:predicted metalloprotease
MPSWLGWRKLPFVTYLFYLPIIMSEKGGIYAVEEPGAKMERKVVSLEKVELLGKSHRQ